LKRRLLRECAFKVLFMVDNGENSLEGALSYVLEDADLSEKEQSFCRELVNGVLEKKDELDKKLSASLVNWKFDRLAAPVRSILRLSLYEMLYRSDVPKVVSINEAIEITKTYHDEESSRFVNGILDKVRKEIEG
jgi:transcription antitermination protein NusB